ncbi:MAG: PD-(D/E)XK nuclease superfamily protein [Limisphaerales bacterium]
MDEKYPFLYFNIIKTGVPTVVLIDGGGYKPAAKARLKD